jgi:regulatory protein SWI6
LNERQSQVSQPVTSPVIANELAKSSGVKDEVRKLRDALSHQKAIEAHLCQELLALRTTANHHEKFCKRIISACCNVPLANVEELLPPLLSAVESDAFNLDLRLVSGFMGRIRSDDSAGGRLENGQNVDENFSCI